MPTKRLAQVVNGRLCLCTSAMCEALNISRETLSLWEAQGCPKDSRGWWPVRDVLIWKGILSTSGLRSEGVADQENWNRKKIEAEAKLKDQKFQEAEFRNALSRGEYIQKDEVIAELQRFFVTLKRSLLALPKRISIDISGRVDPLEVRRIEQSINLTVLDWLSQVSIDGRYKSTKKK